MAKTKSKKKSAAAPKAANDTAKIIHTIEDDTGPENEPAGPPPPPAESIKALKPYVLAAAKNPVQRHVNDVLAGFVSAFLRGEEIDTDAIEKTLFNLKIGNTPLFEIVQKIEEIEKLLSKL